MGSTGKGATQLPANTHSYLLDRTREHPTLSALRASTIGQQGEQMQISPEQGSLMGLLAELTHSVSYLEVGTFTGYSAIAVALSLPPGPSCHHQHQIGQTPLELSLFFHHTRILLCFLIAPHACSSSLFE
jgi:hypothetical protein